MYEDKPLNISEGGGDVSGSKRALEEQIHELFRLCASLLTQSRVGFHYVLLGGKKRGLTTLCGCFETESQCDKHMATTMTERHSQVHS